MTFDPSKNNDMPALPAVNHVHVVGVVAKHQKPWLEDRHAEAPKVLESVRQIVPPFDAEQTSVDWHLETGNTFQNVWVR